MASIITIKGDNLTLDLVLYRRFGEAGLAMLEHTLELNPQAALCGPVLPLGMELTLPDKNIQNDTYVKKPVNLFNLKPVGRN